MTEAEAIHYLAGDSGRVPCSRYGWDSDSCAPIAYATALIVAGETDAELDVDLLDQMMSLVVNDHDDPEYLIREYGPSYDLDPADYLEDA